MNVDTETEMNERRLHGPSTTTQWMIDERARCIILLKFLHDTASIIFRDLYIRFFYICSRVHNHAEFQFGSIKNPFSSQRTRNENCRWTWTERSLDRQEKCFRIVMKSVPGIFSRFSFDFSLTSLAFDFCERSKPARRSSFHLTLKIQF